MMESSINLNLGNEILNGTQVSTNVKQQIIVVPKDKAKLILKEYEEQQLGKVDWVSPLALMFTLLATLLTADFKEGFLGTEKGFWQAFFVIAFIASFIWCCRNCWKAATQKCKSIESVADELCDGTEEKSIAYEVDNLPRFHKWIVKMLLQKK